MFIVTICATANVFDGVFANAQCFELNVCTTAQVDVRFVVRTDLDDAVRFTGLDKGQSDFFANFEGVSFDARPDGAYEAVPIREVTNRGFDDTCYKSFPARVNRCDVTGRRVPDEDGHAIGRAYANTGGLKNRAPGEEGVGFAICTTLRRNHKRSCPVDLRCFLNTPAFHPRMCAELFDCLLS